MKAIVESLKAFPNFNASYDQDKNELIYKQYYHLAVAVDTEAGLIVPVIRDVDKKSVLDLSVELGEIAQKARDRALGVDELQGGTFTISNLGGLGVSHFTPIINTPDLAILGMSRAKNVVQIIDGKAENRLMMPMSLSYDHRVIDGADGARFMRHLIDNIQNFSEKAIKI